MTGAGPAPAPARREVRAPHGRPGPRTVVGDTVVGRLADRHTVPVLAVGLLLDLLFLTGFALLARVPVAAVACLLGIGLAGVTMNPATATRVQRAADDGPLVNTVHSSFITLGVVVGSSLGGVGIDAWGLRGPLRLGAALAALGLLTLLPEVRRTSRATGEESGTAARRGAARERREARGPVGRS
ncbi:MFS transporter [Streptomyces yokosukanensis]|uniref:MFS transporter n=1 Tax=Streptomyces yokosukanensis TaxID=67386 RepID=UPI00099F049E